MPAADVVSYSSVVSAMARAARWPEAIAVLHMEGADEAMWSRFRPCGMVIGILKPTEICEFSMKFKHQQKKVQWIYNWVQLDISFIIGFGSCNWMCITVLNWII